MRLNEDEFKVICLNTTRDDYENLDSITSLLEKFKKEIFFDEAIIEKILKEHIENGYLNVFLFNKDIQDYQKTEIDSDTSINKYWFYVSQKGNEYVDDNWKEEWTDFLNND